LNLKGKEVYDVTTFRCIACGYLDSYALNKQ
jgi:ribosomal protein L37E